MKKIIETVIKYFVEKYQIDVQTMLKNKIKIREDANRLFDYCTKSCGDYHYSSQFCHEEQSFKHEVRRYIKKNNGFFQRKFNRKIYIVLDELDNIPEPDFSSTSTSNPRCIVTVFKNRAQIYDKFVDLFY